MLGIFTLTPNIGDRIEFCPLHALEIVAQAQFDEAVAARIVVDVLAARA